MTRFTEDRAKVVAQELTRLDYDGWTYEAKPVKPELCPAFTPDSDTHRLLEHDHQVCTWVEAKEGCIRVCVECNTGIPLTPSWKVLVYDEEHYLVGDLGLELVSLEQATVVELNEEV